MFINIKLVLNLYWSHNSIAFAIYNLIFIDQKILDEAEKSGGQN